MTGFYIKHNTRLNRLKSCIFPIHESSINDDNAVADDDDGSSVVPRHVFVPLYRYGAKILSPNFLEQDLSKDFCILSLSRYSKFKTFLTAPKTIIGVIQFHSNTQ